MYKNIKMESVSGAVERWNKLDEDRRLDIIRSQNLYHADSLIRARRECYACTVNGDEAFLHFYHDGSVGIKFAESPFEFPIVNCEIICTAC